MADNVELLGIGNLHESFERLGTEMVQKTSLRMVASAANVLKKEAKALALSQGLKKSGTLIRNIAIKRERNAPAGTAQYNLGVRHGRELRRRGIVTKLVLDKGSGRIRVRRMNDPFYWWWLERGHKIVGRATGDQRKGTTTYVTTLRNGKKVTRTKQYSYDSITGRNRHADGFVEARPFIEPSLENKREAALAAMEQRLLKDLERAGK